MMPELKDQIRMDRDALVEALELAGAVQRGGGFVCPFHDDHSPSGGVYSDADGIWRYKCHSDSCAFNGDIYDVRAKVAGRDVGELLKETRPLPPVEPQRIYKDEDAIIQTLPGTHEETYSYANPATRKPDLLVFRFLNRDGKKQFWQASPVEGGFILKAPAKPWPIYNRARIKDAKRVIVVEGEKCVHAIHGLNCGEVATTSPAGAGKAAYADWTPLAGKNVYLWPDNDEPGKAHMREVMQLLERLTPKPAIFQIDIDKMNLGEKEDVADICEERTDVDAGLVVYSAMTSAKSTGAAGDVRELIEATIDGTRQAIDWPWPVLAKLTKALLPGTVTLLCGSPGATKSFALLEALAYWHDRGIPAVVYELEEDRKFHLYRALAQRAENSNLLDDEWVRKNGPASLHSVEASQRFLDTFGRKIWEAPNKPPSLAMLSEWVQERAEEGARVIAIDPITAAEPEKSPWIADPMFLYAVKNTLVKTGASLILVTHPKKGAGTVNTLDELAGGAGYPRLTQTIIWIEAHGKPKTVIVKCKGGHPQDEVAARVNRTFHLLKTRNGVGQGGAIGFYFNGETLKSIEQGGIVRADK